MKTLPMLRHFLNNHLDLMLEKSLKNCHARGLDSIMLDDTPGERIRLFITQPYHELYLNQFNDTVKRFSTQIPLAVHPHHCELTLSPIRGWFSNIIAHRDNDLPHVTLEEFEYRSAILNNGVGGFVSTNQQHNFRMVNNYHAPGRDAVMASSDLHTVFVPREMVSAWFVYEGADDPNYKSIAYSNQDLTKWTPDGSYQKMTKEYLICCLEAAFDVNLS